MTHLRSNLKSILPRFFALTLLAISLVTGVFDLIICNRILIFPFILLMGENKINRFVYLALWFILGIAYLVFLVFTSEYHFKHLGKRESWTLFAKTFGVQLFILGVGYFV